MDSKVTPVQNDIQQLKHAQDQLDTGYATRNRDLTEQALLILKQAMVHYGLDEILLFNFNSDGILP